MPVRAWNQFDVMIGDTMSNNSPHIAYSSPLDKFKNDHLQLINSDSENLSTPKSYLTALPKPQRNPNVFKHWAEPPPAPIRTRKIVEKKPVQIKRRPGSADPRFRRHLDEKTNLVTQSDPKIKKNILLKDANTLGLTESNASKHFENIQINHVNQWLQSQLSSNSNLNPPSIERPSNMSRNIGKTCNYERNSFSMVKKSSSSNHSELSDSKEDKFISKRSLQDNKERLGSESKHEIVKSNKIPSIEPSDNEKMDGSSEYHETLKLMPNDLVHKYPAFTKSNLGSCGSEASLMSELTDKILLSGGSAPCLDGTLSKVSLLKSKGRLEQVVDYYENGKCVSPFIESNDSQLNLMCANPEANSLFGKTIPYSLWYSNKHFCLFMLAGVLFSLVGAIISAVIPLQEYIILIRKRYFEEPEESFLEKYVVNGFSFDLPKDILTKILEKILQVLVMPVNARR